jgi:hypothetical protein
VRRTKQQPTPKKIELPPRVVGKYQSKENIRARCFDSDSQKPLL